MLNRLGQALRNQLCRSERAGQKVEVVAPQSANNADTRPSPSWSILDRSKPWTPSVNTDIAKTFARIRKEREDEAAAESERLAKLRASVKPIGMRAVK